MKPGTESPDVRRKLRRIEADIQRGMTMTEAAQAHGLTLRMFFRLRRMRQQSAASGARRIGAVVAESARLRRVVAALEAGAPINFQLNT